MFALLCLIAAACAVDPALILNQYTSTPNVGQNLSLISGLPYSQPMHSGFFEISPGRFTFFWLIMAESGDADAPLVTWLQGGPGGSSMFGLFAEQGPFSVAANGTLVAREYAWTRTCHMLYIDNPIGCGFSFTNDASGFVTNEQQVGRDLFAFQTLFFQLFPQLLSNRFIVAGESYGGKYGPAFAAEIVAQRAAGNSTINLAGLMVGDGALEPAIQFTDISSLAYYMGFADQTERDVLKGYENKISGLIGAQDFVGAFRVFDEMLNGDFYTFGTYFHNITGLSDYFNELSPTYAPNPYPALLNSPAMAQTIHTGSIRYYDYNASVETALIGDWMRGVQPQLVSVLEAQVPVLIYNGQLDVILGPPLALEVLRQLPWGGTAAFTAAPKTVWRVPGGQVGGYVKQAGPLTHATIRLAGHLAPADSPAFTYDMVQRFVFQKGWEDKNQ